MTWTAPPKRSSASRGRLSVWACVHDARRSTQTTSTSHQEVPMAGTNQGIIDPPIDTLLGKLAPAGEPISKYGLVIYASKRARQINDYYSDLHEGTLFDNVGPLVDSTVEDKP